MKRLAAAGAVMLLLLCVSIPAFSQANFASASGTVTDNSGALIPGVTVRATAVDTNVVTTAITNEAGVYAFPALAPGNYTISAALPGFQTKNLTGLTLGQGTQYRFNFELTVAGLDTQVEVSVAADTLLATSGATIGQVLTQQRVSDLPIVGNNVLDLISVMAGVENIATGAFGREGTTFAGVSAQQITTVRDGIMVQDTRFPTGINSATIINPDLVGEIRLILAPVDAEIGRGNGTIQIQTRSGTNRYTGGAVWSFRNTALDPNTWANNRNQTFVPGVPTNPDGTPSATQRNWSNVNQATVNFGGPIIRNKTFFFVLYDQNDSRQRSSTNFQVLTPCARMGIFRYFDGWNNTNIQGSTLTTGTNPTRPAVNLDGSPLPPATTPGGAAHNGILRHVSVFGPLAAQPTANDCSDAAIDTSTLRPTGAAPSWDTNRTQLDPTGFISRFLAYMPQPNNYETGDGLNTAGFRWLRHNTGLDNLFGVGEATGLRKQINVKIDQNFTANHKGNVNVSYERVNSDDVYQGWPGTFSNLNYRRPLVVTSSFTSTLSSSLLNEARFGIRKTGTNVIAPWEREEYQEEINRFFPPNTNGFRVLPNIVGAVPPGAPGGFAFCHPHSGARPPGGCNSGALTSVNIDHTPVYTFADNVSWTKAAHAFRFGAELRLASSEASVDGPFFSNTRAPAVAVGGTLPATAPATTGASSISSNNPAMTGILNNSAALARNLMNFMSASLSQISHQYFLTDGSNIADWSDGRSNRYITNELKQTEWTLFAKDDYKLSKSLTLNLGVRWEYYGVPYNTSGRTVSPVGGGAAAFGISGRDFTGWMRPGERADVTALQFVGPNSNHPDLTVYPNDYNNVGPAVGFAWQMPWLGEGKTTIRGGYQVTFQGGGRFSTLDPVLSNPPGSTYPGVYTGDSTNTYLDLTDLPAALPAPVPVRPMEAIPLTDRNVSITAFDSAYVSPYVQNLTLSFTHSLLPKVTLDMRYVGTLARKQFGDIPLNTRNFLYNGMLDELNRIRLGTEITKSATDPKSTLDQMFNGINLCATGCTTGQSYGAVGTVVNGVYQSAAYQMRSSNTFNTNLANGNFNAIAGTLNTLNYTKTATANTTLPDVPSTVRGAVLRFNGFDENFFSTNPQFNNVTLMSNVNSNNYHSFQTEVSLRPTHGLSGQMTYSWSKNLGISGGFTNPVERSLDYTHTGGNRTHQLRTNGIVELPFGPDKLLFGNSSGVLARAIEGWQLGMIYNLSSGAPATISTTSMLYANGVPDVVVPVDLNELKGLRWGIRDGNFLEGRYFDNDDLFVKVDDPQCYAVTNLQNLSGLVPATGSPSLRCSLNALAMIVDPGTAGSFVLSQQYPTTFAGDDRSAQIILQTPQPGTRGTLGRNTITGLGTWRFDANMSKRFRIGESKSLQIRIDTYNVLNHPQPENPNFSISNNDAFGEMENKTGGRTFQGQLRFTF